MCSNTAIIALRSDTSPPRDSTRALAVNDICDDILRPFLENRSLRFTRPATTNSLNARLIVSGCNFVISCSRLILGIHHPVSDILSNTTNQITRALGDRSSVPEISIAATRQHSRSISMLHILQDPSDTTLTL